MSLMNRLGNASNPFQMNYKKVLCVCSAGLLRSPTAAFVLSQDPYGYNTRAAGMEPDFALVIVDEVLLEWADEIVCMTKDHEAALKSRTKKPVVRLDIPDSYRYRDPELMKLIKEKYNDYLENSDTDEASKMDVSEE